MLASAFLLILQVQGPVQAVPAPTLAAPPQTDLSLPVLKSGAMEADDYPRSSRRAEEEGRTLVSFVVTTDGTARDCRVERTSGFVALDTATCRIVDTRYRLEPARDSTGRAAETRAQQWVVWKLEPIEPKITSPPAGGKD